MPLYATLPALLEAAVERGWTRAYSRVGDVGVGRYCAYFALYMTSVEFFVYWMHRGLHDVRLGYRCARRAPLRGPFLGQQNCMDMPTLASAARCLAVPHQHIRVEQHA